jgi:hypothetical protein
MLGQVCHKVFYENSSAQFQEAFRFCSIANFPRLLSSMGVRISIRGVVGGVVSGPAPTFTSATVVMLYSLAGTLFTLAFNLVLPLSNKTY